MLLDPVLVLTELLEVAPKRLNVLLKPELLSDSLLQLPPLPLRIVLLLQVLLVIHVHAFLQTLVEVVVVGFVILVLA